MRKPPVVVEVPVALPPPAPVVALPEVVVPLGSNVEAWGFEVEQAPAMPTAARPTQRKERTKDCPSFILFSPGLAVCSRRTTRWNRLPGQTSAKPLAKPGRKSPETRGPTG
jgi:hypothetical protein